MTEAALHPTPEPGQLYEFASPDPQLFLILVVKQHPDIWVCLAIDLQKGHERQICIRRLDPFNGWRQVCFAAPF